MVTGRPYSYLKPFLVQLCTLEAPQQYCVLIGDDKLPVYCDALANWTGKTFPEYYTVSILKRLEWRIPEAAQAYSVSEKAVRRIYSREKGGNLSFTKGASASAA